VFPNTAPTPRPATPPSSGEVPVLLPAASGPATATDTPPVLLMRQQLSSSVLAQRETLLEIHAELHVYGRARRDWELVLLGRRVPLAGDGSFELRQPIGVDTLLTAKHPDLPES
jgi:hypothetical protein